MHIKVIAIKPINSGNFKAFADIEYGDLEIHGMRIVQQEGQAAYVAWPQTTVEKDGKKNYWPVIKSTPEVKQPVQDAILAAWKNES
jgi:hypothetical protein